MSRFKGPNEADDPAMEVPEPQSEGSGAPKALDKDRRVFAVPVTFTLEATLYVLARDLTDARNRADATDLNDLIAFDRDQVWTDNTERLDFQDVDRTDIEVIAARPVSIDDYDPTDHPDWSPVTES